MPDDPDNLEFQPLPYGLYECVLDGKLEQRIKQQESGVIQFEQNTLDPGESHVVLADHLRLVLRKALHGLTGEDRLAKQVEVVNGLLRGLELFGNWEELQLSHPPRRLLGIWPAEGSGSSLTERPDTSLALGCLLAGTRLDPSLASQIGKELASADRLDILCSFIKWSGIRILAESLKAWTARPGVQLRVLSTSYMGATELKAIEFLRSLPNTEVRISYDTHRTRLHAKAYLFHRCTGFGTAYVGSANMTRPALTEGLEWTIKVSQYESSHLWDRLAATFETYWLDTEFQPYNEADKPRLEKALEQEKSGDPSGPDPFLFELRPWGFQQEILDRLDAERLIQRRDRHLVVAATGTGKTMIAAFDYRQWSRQQRTNSGAMSRFLFVAHREELLKQSLETFRAVLRDPNFGDLMVGGRRPEQFDHVFVSIQSYHSQSLEGLPAGHYDYVVIDEFHHAAAPSYERLLDHLRPKVLLGLTATPERGDGIDLLSRFGGHLSSEIRLADAINRKLLSPFQYFAISDNIDLSGLKWQRGGYRTEELTQIYTGNDLRAALVIDKVRSILLHPRKARGLGFCVSVAHAQFMAARFCEAGIPAEALSAETPRIDRYSAQERLRKREINFLFVVDLYNEGVDIPEIDSVLFLRPTESLTVFLQQLGRGLRLYHDKDCLTVLDFVGAAHKKFRFDLRFRALLTDPSESVDRQVQHGFTHLPAGCSIVMERIARQHVLENIRQNLGQSKQILISSLRDLAGSLGRIPTLSEFFHQSGVEPDDIYRRGVGFSRLVSQAGLSESFKDPDEERLTKGLRRVAHMADANRIRFLLQLLGSDQPRSELKPFDSSQERMLLMLDFCLWGASGLPDSSEAGLSRLASNPTMRHELRELLEYRLSHVSSVAPLLELPFICPMTLHAPYTRDEILAALGRWTRTQQPSMREGVLHIPEIKTDVFFVTLHKTEREYSPTTMYQDYALNERLFHWQSQSTTSADSATGRRYIEHKQHGYTVLLFGREHKKRLGKSDGLAEPYYFLGPAQYINHAGSRPMSITWQLDFPLPARLFRRLARLAVA